MKTASSLLILASLAAPATAHDGQWPYPRNEVDRARFASSLDCFQMNRLIEAQRLGANRVAWEQFGRVGRGLPSPARGIGPNRGFGPGAGR